MCGQIADDPSMHDGDTIPLDPRVLRLEAITELRAQLAELAAADRVATVSPENLRLIVDALDMMARDLYLRLVR